MGILAGKRLLVTGVLTDSSIAFHVARVAQQEGATVVLTGFGRLSLVERIARRLPEPPPVLELDVTDEGQLASLAQRVGEHVDGLDGVVHGIAFAPQSALGGNFLQTPWPDVATALHVSAYSLKALAMAALPLMGGGGSIVGLDFDASLAWPAYDWMGVAKATLESSARYLARDLGPRGIRGEPGGRRPAADHGRQEHPRLQWIRGAVGQTRTARLGPVRSRARRARLRGPAVGLVSGDDGGDRARGTGARTPSEADAAHLPEAAWPAPCAARARPCARTGIAPGTNRVFREVAAGDRVGTD
jgi:enoyl ACP reductase